MKEINSYLKLFHNYERRFKRITILIPLYLYDKNRYIIEFHANKYGYIKSGEISDTVIFKNWS